jgi:hypothetical protein
LNSTETLREIHSTLELHSISAHQDTAAAKLVGRSRFARLPPPRHHFGSLPVKRPPTHGESEAARGVGHVVSISSGWADRPEESPLNIFDCLFDVQKTGVLRCKNEQRIATFESAFQSKSLVKTPGFQGLHRHTVLIVNQLNQFCSMMQII